LTVNWITKDSTVPLTLPLKSIALVLILLATSLSVHSEELRYIRDELYVPLRSGQTEDTPIVHKGLVSGTPVTIIGTSEDKTFSLVRTQKGTEGWIQTQYLSTEPAGRDLYKAASEKLAILQAQNKQLNQQLATLKNQEQQPQEILASHSSLDSVPATIDEAAANAIEFNVDHTALLEENQALKNQLELLSTDNQRLNDEKNSDDFLNGAFAVLLGVMITLAVPRLWPQKRTEWA
jgi:SH3 domain protein